jgi:hypothetical protein
MPDLEWQPLESSWITEAAYDADHESIYVRFNNGRAYCYDACPIDVWEAFIAPGGSPGKYLNEVLKFKPFRRCLD